MKFSYLVEVIVVLILTVQSFASENGNLTKIKVLKYSGENMENHGRNLFGTTGGFRKINRIGTNNRFQGPLSSGFCMTQVNTPGICMHKSDCTKSGGIPSGACYPSTVCCSKNLQCGETTAAKLSFMEGTATQSIDDCTYKFVSHSLLVCQLRVDFSISIPGPEDVVPLDGVEGAMRQCTGSYLQIGNYRFCGTDIFQHVYIPFKWDYSTNKEILIRHTTPQAATWRISVLQVECPPEIPLNALRQASSGHGGTRVNSGGWGNNIRNALNFGNLGNWGNAGNFGNWGNFGNIGGNWGNLGGNLGNLGGSWGNNLGPFSDTGTAGNLVHSLSKQIMNIDGGLIAPAGCLQYHITERGIIRSFNYNGGDGQFLPNMRYAICIRKPAYATGLKLNFTKFTLSTNDGGNIGGVGCRSSDPLTDSDDYMLLPFNEEFDEVQFCGYLIQERIIEITSDVPYVIYFNSGSLLRDNFNFNQTHVAPANRSFEIQYEVLK